MIRLCGIWGFPRKYRTLWCRSSSFCINTWSWPNPDHNLRGDQLHQWRKGSCSQEAREGSRCTSHSRMVGSLFHRWGLRQRPKVSSSLKSLPWLPRTEKDFIPWCHYWFHLSSLLSMPALPSLPPITSPTLSMDTCPAPATIVSILPWALQPHNKSPLGEVGSLLGELSKEGWTRISAPWQVSLWGQVLGEKRASISKVTLQ